MSEYEEILRNHPNILIRLVYIAGLADLDIYGDVDVNSYAAMLEEAASFEDPEDLMYLVSQRVKQRDPRALDELLIQIEDIEF